MNMYLGGDVNWSGLLAQKNPGCEHGVARCRHDGERLRCLARDVSPELAPMGKARTQDHSQCNRVTALF